MSDIFGKIILGAMECMINGEDPNKAADRIAKEIIRKDSEACCERSNSHVTGGLKILIEKPEGDFPAKAEIMGTHTDLMNAFAVIIGNFAYDAMPDKLMAEFMVKRICDFAIYHINSRGVEK